MWTNLKHNFKALSETLCHPYQDCREKSAAHREGSAIYGTILLYHSSIKSGPQSADPRKIVSVTSQITIIIIFYFRPSLVQNEPGGAYTIPFWQHCRLTLIRINKAYTRQVL